jgi:hypothetical protein
VTPDPLALTQAAAAARLEVRRLADAHLEPDLPLTGYLQPLQNFTAAIISAASTAARLADIAVLNIIDPAVADDAGGDLKKAERRAHQAADQVSHAFDEIRRALRAGGQTVPYPGGTERLRRYKTTADALASLSAEAGKAARVSEPLALGRLEDPAAGLADMLGLLGQASAKLRTGIDDAYTRLPENGHAKASRATDHMTQAGTCLARASGYATWASGTISDAITEQRKLATW